MRRRQRWRRRRVQCRRRNRGRKSIKPVLRDEYCRRVKRILYTCIFISAKTLQFGFFSSSELVFRDRTHTHAPLLLLLLERKEKDKDKDKGGEEKLTLSITSSIALCSLYLSTTPASHSFKLKQAAKNLTLHSQTRIKKTPLFSPFRSLVTTRLTCANFSGGGRKRARGMLAFMSMVSRSCQKSHSRRSAGGSESCEPRSVRRKACLDQRPGSMRSRRMKEG